MSFKDLPIEKARALVGLIFKSCEAQHTVLEGENKKSFKYLLIPKPSEDVKNQLVLASFKGRNPILTVAGGLWLTRHEKNFLRNLELKIDKWKTSLQVINVQLRHGMSEKNVEETLVGLYAWNPTLVDSLIPGLDKFIEAEAKQKEQAKKYAEKRGATTFSYSEQRTICGQILRFVEKEYVNPMTVSMFKESEKVKIRTTYSIPTDTYYGQLYSNMLSPKTIDPSGKELFDSIPKVFNLDVEEILNKLIGAGGYYGADARRFALKFSDKYNVAGLVDTNPEVRLLAKEKVSKK